MHVHSRIGAGVLAGSDGDSASSGAPNNGSRSSADPGTGAVDLSLRGPLSTAPVFEVSATAPLYWQGAIFSAYDGRAWLAAGPLQQWDEQATAAGTVQTAPLSAADASHGVVTQYTVNVLSPEPIDAVFGPGSAVTYTGSGRVVEDADGTAHILRGPSAGATYEVSVQTPGDTSDAALLGASGADPSSSLWLSLPTALPSRVGALAASLAAGQQTRLGAVNAVENYLRTHELYNLQSPVPADGEDAVDDFLFLSHQGFCEQFASAAVVMLRTLGIPARLVTGYVDGTLTADKSGRVFSGTDAHAWVQVYYPGIGWVDSDPTAGASTGPRALSARARLGSTLERLWRAIPFGRTGAVVGVLALLPIGFAFGELGRRWVRRRRRFAGADRGRAGDGPVLASYLRLDVALRRVERARAPAESFGEFAQRLGGVVASATEVAAALAALECETYGRTAPCAEAAASAIDVFDRLRMAAGSQTVAVAAGVR
jgi:protein-glutamine gamma-glutamyltransferase